MENLEKQIAEHLLQIKAIKLQPSNPFTWASGWKSPIYCDNRKTLSFPNTRNLIKEHFSRIISEKYKDCDLIAGVATGAIAQGALVADNLNLPFVYVRSSSKKHGLENLVEGHIVEGQKVVVVEDLVSTGASSLKAVEALRKAGCEVLGMLAIFSYGFNIAEENFKNSNCELTILSSYNTLINKALEIDYISEKDIETLNEWRKNPEKWKV